VKSKEFSAIKLVKEEISRYTWHQDVIYYWFLKTSQWKMYKNVCGTFAPINVTTLAILQYSGKGTF
jgi:hypothetical protein